MFINDEFERVCFRFDLYPNGAGSHMVVEYAERVYVFHPFFQETSVFESLGDAQDELIRQRMLLRGRNGR